MLLVRKVDIIETDHDIAELQAMSSSPDASVPVNGGRDMEKISVIKELVKGRLFRRPDGLDIIVGLSRQAQQVLGLYYEVWDQMETTLYSTREQLFKSQRAINKLRRAPFFTRLKWLFRGCDKER